MSKFGQHMANEITITVNECGANYTRSDIIKMLDENDRHYVGYLGNQQANEVMGVLIADQYWVDEFRLVFFGVRPKYRGRGNAHVLLNSFFKRGLCDRHSALRYHPTRKTDSAIISMMHFSFGFQYVSDECLTRMEYKTCDCSPKPGKSKSPGWLD